MQCLFFYQSSHIALNPLVPNFKFSNWSFIGKTKPTTDIALGDGGGTVAATFAFKPPFFDHRQYYYMISKKYQGNKKL